MNMRGIKKSRHLRQRGFVMMPDLMTAMIIVSMLIVVMFVARGMQRRAEAHLADQMHALRQAESILSNLQNVPGRDGPSSARPTIPNHSHITLTPVSPGWVRVMVKINSASASLIGPTEAAP